MNCGEIRLLRHGYKDGELDAARTMEVQQHLAGCPACQKAFENVQALKAALKSEELYFSAPTQLKRRVRTSIGIGEKKAASGPWFSWSWLKPALAGGGFAAVILLVALMMMRPSAEDLLAQEVTAGHVRSLMANHLTDVASTDQHTVKPWFEGKLDFAPPVTNLGEQGFPLIGGRLDYLNGRQVAALAYQRNKHVINVFIWPAQGSDSSREVSLMRQGYNLVQWNHEGMTCWAISDLNAIELEGFVKLLKR